MPLNSEVGVLCLKRVVFLEFDFGGAEMKNLALAISFENAPHVESISKFTDLLEFSV